MIRDWCRFYWHRNETYCTVCWRYHLIPKAHPDNQSNINLFWRKRNDLRIRDWNRYSGSLGTLMTVRKFTILLSSSYYSTQSEKKFTNIVRLFQLHFNSNNEIERIIQVFFCNISILLDVNIRMFLLWNLMKICYYSCIWLAQELKSRILLESILNSPNQSCTDTFHT